jgi:hypothetical protein
MFNFKNAVSTFLDKKVLGNVTLMESGILMSMFVGFVLVVNTLSYIVACNIAS